MADLKVKISELPESGETQALYVPGVATSGQTIKFPLGQYLSQFSAAQAANAQVAQSASDTATLVRQSLSSAEDRIAALEGATGQGVAVQALTNPEIDEIFDF